MNETFNDLLAALEPVVEAFSRLGVADLLRKAWREVES